MTPPLSFSSSSILCNIPASSTMARLLMKLLITFWWFWDLMMLQILWLNLWRNSHDCLISHFLNSQRFENNKTKAKSSKDESNKVEHEGKKCKYFTKKRHQRHVYGPRKEVGGEEKSATLACDDAPWIQAHKNGDLRKDVWITTTSTKRLFITFMIH